jgi:hypothetical protein
MSPLSLDGVALAVPSLDEAVERFARLGLPAGDAWSHPALDARCCSLSVGPHRLVLVETVPSAPLSAPVPLGRGPFPYLCLRVECLDPYRSQPAAVPAPGVAGPAVWLALEAAGGAVEVVRSAPRPSTVGDTAILRIESLPWAVAARGGPADELAATLGLVPDPSVSNLVFPDLSTTNSLVFVGPDCYLDLNEATDASSPVARQVGRRGNGQFAIVLEPDDLDAAVGTIRSRGVPTSTQAPIDLKVTWPDGRRGTAARIIAVDRDYAYGARIFLSEPTFPW